MSRANEPAYPRKGSTDGNGNVDYGAAGMTIREAFVMAALQGLASRASGDYTIGPCNADIAARAVALADATLAAAAEVRRLKWIPVGERLPDINEPVALLNLGRFENCDHERCIQDVGYLSDTYYRPYWSVRGQSAIALDGYTHWMPLPEPPEGA